MLPLKVWLSYDTSSGKINKLISTIKKVLNISGLHTISYYINAYNNVNLPDVSTIDYRDKLMQIIISNNISYFDDSILSLSNIRELLFINNNYLSYISCSECSAVGNFAFALCGSLKNVFLPNCYELGSGTFMGCDNLYSITCDNVLKINDYCFNGCSDLQGTTDLTLDFPVCSYIGAAAFAYCNSLYSINLPECTYIGSSAFELCERLVNVYNPYCLHIDDHAFEYAVELRYVNIENVSIIGSLAFNGCRNFLDHQPANFQSCTKIGESAFRYCTAMGNNHVVNFPLCSEVGSGAFHACAGMHTIRFDKVEAIGGGAFFNCLSLEAIYFLMSSVPIFKSSIYDKDMNSYIEMFDGTCLSSDRGIIYVLPSLYSEYYRVFEQDRHLSNYLGHLCSYTEV